MIKSKEQCAVEAVLAPYYPQISRTVLGAWKEHREQNPEFLLKTSSSHPRTRAAIQWSLMVNHATEQFRNTPVQVEEKGGTCNFILGGLLFRLKKLDRRGFSRNFATQMLLDFYAQVEIDGIPSVLRLDIGYILNSAATAIEEIRVVRREGNRKKWDYSIPLSAAGVGIESEVEVQRHYAIEVAAPRASRVRVRRHAAKRDPLTDTGTK